MRWTHRWIGLSVGLVLVVISLSGSVLLFQPQLFRWVHGEMIPAHLPQQMGSIDRWIANAHAAVPSLHGPIVIWPPHTSHNVSDAGMVVFSGATPGGIGHLGLVGVLVAPASGDVLGVVDIDRSPAYAPIFLHSELLGGPVGRIVVGIVAAGSLVLFAIGLYLWWPPRGRLLKKLSLRPLRSTLTTAPRLHDSVAVWLLVFLFASAATGLYLAQPEWVEPALQGLPGADTHAAPAAASQCRGPISFDTAIERARALVPGGVPRTIRPENESTLRPWEIVFTPRDSQAAPKETHVVADLDCGVLTVETPAMRALPDSVELWLGSVHDGTAFGRAGEIFVTVLGLAPLILAWSGILMWLRRRRWLAQKKARATLAMARNASA
jgi:uncharacterized iron-regulated membrane protein